MAYPGGPITFWDMMCGEFPHLIVELQKRPLDEALRNGDYENDREFRRDFHRWLSDIWQEKDDRLHALLEDRS